MSNDQVNVIDSLKSINRLDAAIVSSCGKRCFANLKSDKLNSSENACISSCVQKYYDSLTIGDKVFDHFSNHYTNLTNLQRGKYEEAIGNLKDQI